MKIAFEKNGTSWFAKAIMAWGKSPYYHSILIFEDKSSFTATTSDKVFGTCFETFDYDNYDINRWVVFNLPINKDEEEKIREWCKTEDNCWYDVIGLVFANLIPISFENPWWWFCSEVCCAALQRNLGWFPEVKSYQVDPGQLHKLIVDKIKELN